MPSARQLFELGLMKLKTRGLTKGKDVRVIPRSLDDNLPPITDNKPYKSERDENLGDPGGVKLIPRNRGEAAPMGPGKRPFDYIDPIGLPEKQKYKKRLLQS